MSILNSGTGFWVNWHFEGAFDDLFMVNKWIGWIMINYERMNNFIPFCMWQTRIFLVDFHINVGLFRIMIISCMRPDWITSWAWTTEWVWKSPARGWAHFYSVGSHCEWFQKYFPIGVFFLSIFHLFHAFITTCMLHATFQCRNYHSMHCYLHAPGMSNQQIKQPHVWNLTCPSGALVWCPIITSFSHGAIKW